MQEVRGDIVQEAIIKIKKGVEWRKEEKKGGGGEKRKPEIIHPRSYYL